MLYLERSGHNASFAGEARKLVAEFAEMAGLCLRSALEKQSLLERSRSLERNLFARYRFQGIVTQDPAMLALLQTVAQAATADVTVLIEGESGTGKELIAQALHRNSPRANRAYVALHCAALSASLLESELFGHVKGAFSGALRERTGRLASAHQGTLFLDEVAEIPLETQAKLLRFLQFGELQRIGADHTEKVNVRLVAATHQSLSKLIAAGQFREDLYFRLKVIELRIPPLRERRSDIPLLLEHFLRQHWKRPGESPRWSSRAEQLLMAYAWPGNVRELEHLVQRASVLAPGPELGVELLPPELLQPTKSAGEPIPDRMTAHELEHAKEQAVAELERKFLIELLERCDGNVSRAAREAQMHRRSLQKLLARHRLEPADETAAMPPS